MDLFSILADWVIEFVIYLSVNTEYVYLLMFFGLSCWITAGLFGRWRS